MIVLQCPAGHQMRAPELQPGQQVRCPLCQRLVTRESIAPSDPSLSATRADLDSSDLGDKLALGIGEPSAPHSTPASRAYYPLTPRGLAAEERGYRPDAKRVAEGRRLAIVLATLTALTLLPLLSAERISLSAGPGWVRLLIVLAGLQLAYVAWMSLLPDWSTVWSTMIVYALSAATFGMGFAMTLLTTDVEISRLPLGLGDVRRAAVWWMPLLLGLNAAGAFLCGRTSYRWRKELQREE